jgi:hypothetical protein
VNANAVPPNDDLPPGGLRPQFRLITLFLLLTLVGLIFAAFQYLGPMGTFALILAILVVIAHVAGNAIGTSLRDSVRPKLQPRETIPHSGAIAKLTAPVSRLAESRALGRPIYWITAASAIVWGICGITLIKWISAKPISLASSIVGALVLAGLGAFWTFVIGSFIQVAFGAIFHALRQSNSPPKNH